MVSDRVPIVGALTTLMVGNVLSLMAGGIVFSGMHLWATHPTVAAIAGLIPIFCLIPAFVVARFSFGYLVAVQLTSMVIGFVWLSFFSEFDYPHAVARWSMIVSLFAALAPLLFLDINIKRPSLSAATERKLLLLLAGLSVVVLCACAAYGLAFGDPYGTARNAVVRPALLNYLSGIVVAAILPYLFAQAVRHKRTAFAIGVLLLALCYYPVLLNKTVLFLPFWLPFLALLFTRFEPRLAYILALLIPLTIGMLDLAAVLIFPRQPFVVFGTVNLRFTAIPSMALDHYADFFSHHDYTRFCQISLVRKLWGCAYGELGSVMASAYQIGNLNASFLATEGIASVGFVLAPLISLVCGLVLALGAMASRHLSPRFVAVSSGIAVPAIMNIPLTTALVSGGVGLLFLLWWLTPQTDPARAGEASDTGRTSPVLQAS